MAAAAPGWLSRQLADVPAGNAWLAAAELLVLAGVRIAPRREAWRLGRFTAKAALSEWLALAPAEIEVLAAADGAPEAWWHGQRLPVSVSLSHRAGRALAVVADDPCVVGCDLELIEPRSDAFCREWLAPEEQRRLRHAPADERPLLANLFWSVKEAGAKARREGLRLDVRDAVVTAGAASCWGRTALAWSDGTQSTAGWWRADGDWVIAIAALPAIAATCAPRRLAGVDAGS